MARLQDFNTVTPTSSDKLLVVQSQGQGLVPYGSKLDSANPTGTGKLSLNRKANTTEGNFSVAIGDSCTASAPDSVAMGDSSVASGNYAIAGGLASTASGATAIAIGVSCEASGNRSQALGSGTIANHKSQHVFGEYNTADGTASAGARGNYVEIVGNGTGANANQRSNARTLDWSGNEVLAGGLKINNLYDVLSSQTTILSSGNDMNDIKTQGFYYVQTGVTNAPQSWCWCIVIGGSGVMQIVISTTKIYTRAFTGSPLAWESWKSITLS